MTTDTNAEQTNAAAPVTAPSRPKAKKAAAKAKPAKKAVKTAKPRVSKPKYVNVAGKCLCGCGGATTRRFLPGHDAKLHGMVVDAFKEEKTLRVGKATYEYLMTAFYVKGNSKIKAAIASR